jgi:hypothetical protein
VSLLAVVYRWRLTQPDNFWNSKVQARRAPAPEGPWSEAFELYQGHPITEGSTCYAAVPHPYYDPSGKTLVVTYTNHPNTIQAVKVVCQRCNSARIWANIDTDFRLTQAMTQPQCAMFIFVSTTRTLSSEIADMNPKRESQKDLLVFINDSRRCNSHVVLAAYEPRKDESKMAAVSQAS